MGDGHARRGGEPWGRCGFAIGDRHRGTGDDGACQSRPHCGVRSARQLVIGFRGVDVGPPIASRSHDAMSHGNWTFSRRL